MTDHTAPCLLMMQEPTLAQRLIRLTSRLLRAGHCYPWLEVEDLPDHLKRDLGFLDGRDPLRRDRFSG